ncbi:MAG: Maf family protein [Spirochaetaceae bacterium]|jgi:septum formation protein|nr:Maf family protein [Spirochaetaceae bacterium]
MDPIILASGSIRRHEYFKTLHLPFSIMVPGIVETNDKNLTPPELARDLAERKINAILKNLVNRIPPWICAADTLISLDGEVIGKSKSRTEAKETLLRLAGREHEVITAIALFNGKEHKTDCRTDTSIVQFAPLSEAEIEWYLDTCEWQGSAGAYKVQGLAACFIERITGSYSSIVGIPVRELYLMLRDNGYEYS